jgi:hypothetical protein
VTRANGPLGQDLAGAHADELEPQLSKPACGLSSERLRVFGLQYDTRGYNPSNRSRRSGSRAVVNVSVRWQDTVSMRGEQREQLTAQRAVAPV